MNGTAVPTEETGLEVGPDDLARRRQRLRRKRADGAAFALRLNMLLPDNIKVLGALKVRGRELHAEKHCDSRRYDYLLPVDVLAPHLTKMGPVPSRHDTWNAEWVGWFRKLKHLCQKFQGRHNWHNF